MIPSKVMAKLATLGLSEEQAVAVAGMLTEVEEATASQAAAVAEISRSKARARVQKWRDTHKSNVTERNETSQGVTKRLTGERVPVDDKTSNLEIEPQKEESKKVARGTRLPSDFVLPDEWFQWALRRGLPAHRIPIEFEKLTNWAANAPASKAVKANWFKAWQNWVIGAIDALPQNRAPPASQQAPSMSQLLTVIRDRPNENQPGPPEDRSGFRAAIPHLRTVGAG